MLRFYPAVTAFYILFPAFVVSQVLFFAGYSNFQFPGGLTLLAALCIPILALKSSAAFMRYKQYALASRVTFFGFLLVFFLSLLFGEASENVEKSHMAGLIQMLGLYLMARHWPANIDSRSLHRIVAALIMISALILWTSPILSVGGILDLVFVRFNYQAVAMAILAMSFFVMPNLDGKLKWTVLSVTLATFFAVGARSEIIAFVFSTIAVEFLRRGPSGKSFMKMILFSAIFLGIFTFILNSWFPDSRVWGLLTLTADDSFIARSELVPEAWRTIMQSPILGSYGEYRDGYYVHNILSAWVDTGLLGFGLLLATIVFCAFRLRPSGNEIDKLYLSAVMCFISAVILMLFAKYFSYPLIGMAVGLVVRNAINQRHYPRRHTVKFGLNH